MYALIQRARVICRLFSAVDYIDFGYNALPAFKMGVHAAYRQLDSKWGMKFFANARQRDDSYKCQKHLYKHGICPEVGKKFDAIDRCGRIVYGFITEHVEEMWMALSYDKQAELWDERQKLENKAHKLTKSCDMDLHGNNIGLTRDGRLLVIDVSFRTKSLNEEPEFEFYMLEHGVQGRTIQIGA